MFHAQKRRILSGQLNDTELSAAMDEAEKAENEYIYAEQSRDLISNARWADLIAIYRRWRSECAA
jgi:hypothetical protein